MVLFDIIVDEDGDARIELFAHGRGSITELVDKTQNDDICEDRFRDVKHRKTATEQQQREDRTAKGQLQQAWDCRKQIERIGPLRNRTGECPI